MDTLKDLFFFIGSLLGMVAFSRTTLDALKARNLRSWSRVREFIREEDLKDLEFQIFQRRSVTVQLLIRLGHLVDDLRERNENLVFGPVLRRQIEQHLERFCALYDDLRRYIQTPWWQPESHQLEHGERIYSIGFSKQAFFDEDVKAELDYVTHLERAADLAIEMRIEYRALAILVELDILEIPFTCRIATKRSQLLAMK